MPCEPRALVIGAGTTCATNLQVATIGTGPGFNDFISGSRTFEDSTIAFT